MAEGQIGGELSDVEKAERVRSPFGSTLHVPFLLENWLANRHYCEKMAEGQIGGELSDVDKAEIVRSPIGSTSHVPFLLENESSSFGVYLNK